jgi:crossover junction endodeoxyribonuclease RuvC
MKILGIDPGTRHCGYGVVESISGQPVFVTSGIIHLVSREAMHCRLLSIYDQLNRIVNLYSPCHMALEKIFYHKNARSSFALGQARGVALLLAAQRGLSVFEYNSTEVKKSVTGSGRAEKVQVKKMVKVIMNITHPLGEDDADALALCICHMNSFRLKGL